MYRVLLDGTPYDPVNFSELKVSFEKFTDFGAYFFRLKLTDSLRFARRDNAAAYDYILSAVALDQCQDVTIVIQQYCASGWVDAISGYFTRQNCKINLEQCVIDIDVNETDEFSCIIDNSDKLINILADPTLTIDDFQYVPVYGLEIMGVANFGGGVCSGFIPDWGTPYAAAWSGTHCLYARYVSKTRCVGGQPQEPPPAATTWTLLSNDCATDGTATYWREAKPTEILISPNISTCTPVPTCVPAPCASLCLDGGTVINATVIPIRYERMCGCPLPTQLFINNTRRLVEVMNLIIGTWCSGYSLESELLTNETNPVTGNPKNPMTDLHIVAKSDVVNPTASTWASILKLSARILFGDLSELLNARWTVNKTTSKVVFEHISGILLNTIGIDTTTLDGGKWDVGRRSISYDKLQVPSSETFRFPSQSQDINFEGLPIVYTASCVGSSDLPHQTQLLETEITRIFQNTNEGLEGAVLVAVESILQADNKAEDGALTNIFIPNAPLSWANLHRDYYLHDRFLHTGELNGASTVFTTTKPVKRQDNLVVPICCISDFNPLELVRTSIGDGRFESGVYDFNTEKLTFSLKYEDSV